MKRTLVRAAVFLTLIGGTAMATTGTASAATCWGRVFDHSKVVQFVSALPQVRYGNHGHSVLLLQLALRDAGYQELQGTGNYASNTLHAVRDFQRKHGIKDSGIVGSKTWHALMDNKSLARQPGFTIYLNPGEHDGDQVSALWDLLSDIYPYSVTGVPWSGTYEPSIQRIVQDFQRRAGIKASGIVGPKTSQALIEAASAMTVRC
ncbi:peptidoglycan-binding domain-containing protein [Actinocrispum wychmicini]|uniref:Peptidoglycan hydrolase-like protein with peptidoglycan-binding domain n=1 Tax=Actinocrispum wychmicini TaxID=1213861 RepID=A0A4V2S8S9_9PSEU|nr:peptidoglycan-binding protein [Actinocrispum wychmicini]TCO65050.1 peptidoglycan hydrolase-like protein with peptidoglycan-binding domain [Actinocrispum wychmicini]